MSAVVITASFRRDMTRDQNEYVFLEDDPRPWVPPPVVRIDGQERAKLSRGDFFGEMSLLSDTTHTKNVQAVEDSELLVLPGDSYHVAASDAPQCAQATIEFIERRDPGD
jgi:hypothetical protein